MINIRQFDEYILKPTLEYLDMDSLAARQLMLGTALVESGLSFIKQVGGSAYGIFQVEPATYIDNYDNYLNYESRKELKEKFEKLQCGVPCGAAQMTGNLYYNTGHARLVYFRNPEALPKEFDYKTMTNYHKKIYNTSKGVTDVSKSIEFFKKACNLIIE